MTDFVWNETLDAEKFRATVERTAPYQGKLTVTEIKSKETLLEEEVGIIYDAPFGPDVDDVALWQRDTIIAVDKWYEDHGVTPPS